MVPFKSRLWKERLAHRPHILFIIGYQLIPIIPLKSKNYYVAVSYWIRNADFLTHALEAGHAIITWKQRGFFCCCCFCCFLRSRVQWGKAASNLSNEKLQYIKYHDQRKTKWQKIQWDWFGKQDENSINKTQHSNCRSVYEVVSCLFTFMWTWSRCLTISLRALWKKEQKVPLK